MRKYVFAGSVIGIIVAAIIGIFAAGSFVSSSDSQANAADCATTPGILPGEVPQPYNSIFTAASNHYQIDPALLAAIFMSEHDNNWPDPNSVQATSPSGAMGWFQFMPPTWAAYSGSNPTNPNGNPQSLVDSAFAAAHLLHDLGGSVNMQPGDPMNPLPRTVAWVAGAYNGPGHPVVGDGQNDAYRTNAVKEYQQFNSGQGSVTANPPQSAGTAPQQPDTCSPVISANGYVNPFVVTPQITRAIDQGVDYAVPTNSPLRAIGNATIVHVVPNFYNGQPSVSFQLLDGSLKGKCIYYAEEVASAPYVGSADSASISTFQSEIGSTVRAGQTIAYFATSGTSLEFGFANCDNGDPLAKTTGGYKENYSTAAGMSFNKFMVSLGNPSDAPYPVTLGSEAQLQTLGYP